MPKSKLAKDREQMIEFVRDNTVGENLEVIVEKGDFPQHSIQFSSEGNDYLIKMLSRQAELPSGFEYDVSNFDESRRQLMLSLDALKNFIAESNENGKVPGIIMLRSDTDYDKILGNKPEDNTHYNKGGHFLKQALHSDWNPKPFFDERELDPIEVVMKYLNHQSKGLPGKRPTYERQKTYRDTTKRQLGKKVYTPENYYFDPKTGKANVVYFHDLANPLLFRDVECPVCHYDNEHKNHTGCKDEKQYHSYRHNRDRARYSKLITTPNERQPGSQLIFNPSELIVPGMEGMKLARLRGAKE